MFELKVNEEMAWELCKYEYTIVYAKSPVTWWIACQTNKKEEAKLVLQDLKENGKKEGEYFMVDMEGNRI